MKRLVFHSLNNCTKIAMSFFVRLDEFVRECPDISRKFSVAWRKKVMQGLLSNFKNGTSVMLGRMLLLLICAFPIMLITGCGDDNGDGIARISDYTTTVPRDVTTPANSRFIGFNIQSSDDRIGYTIGYAVIENGVRTDHILYEFDPMTMAEFASISCSFVISGTFFGEHISIVHRQSGDGWSFISDSIPVEMPALTGYSVLTRPLDFEASLGLGDDLVIAAAIGSAENEVLRPITIEFFDNFRTIDDAMGDRNLEDRPFLLIFYVSANS